MDGKGGLFFLMFGDRLVFFFYEGLGWFGMLVGWIVLS